MSDESKSMAQIPGRRGFLVKAVVGALGGIQMTACGGGGSSAPAGNEGGGGTDSGGNPPQAVNPDNVVRISLASGTQTNYPLQFGRPFVAGEIIDTPLVLLDGAVVPAQVDVKTRHVDGSVRFAVISLVLPTIDATQRAITFAEQAAPVSSAASVASMLADFDFDATIAIEAGGAPLPGSPVSARDMLAALGDADLAAETREGGVQSRYWTVGPVCTSLILCDHELKSRDLGSDANKAIRPLFHVQFWPTARRYYVRHVVEIGDVTKLKDELGLTLTFSTGRDRPVSRLSQSGVNLYAGTWQSRGFWDGTDLPRLNIVHGVAYLAQTRAMPNFDPGLVMNEAAVSDYARDWSGRSKTLLSSGYWQKAMASAGGRPDLGLLPKWEVVTMYSGAAHMQDICERHSEFAGAWAFYFREGNPTKTTFDTALGIGRVVSKLSRPTVFLYDGNNQIGTGDLNDRFVRIGTLSGSRDGWSHDHAHTPGLFWWQYLSTGEAFWQEKLLQLAAWSQFVVNPGTSFSSLGNGESSRLLILNGVQVRGWGWQFRNRARAWWAALDNSPEKSLFLQSLSDATAQRAGLYDVPGLMTSDPIRISWNTNHATWYNNTPVNPRPNALHFWDRQGLYSEVQLVSAIGSPPPDDWGGGATAPWMQNYVAMSLWHAVELGYEAARPLAGWAIAQTIAIATSSQPRHIADYVIPDVKNNGRFYQSLDDIYDGYSHDANGEVPTIMPADSSRGFSGSGSVGTYGVTFEGYGSIAASALAMAKGEPLQGDAWSVIAPWQRATTYYNHDPRYAILPRP